jgi:hypothetical protein
MLKEICFVVGINLLPHDPIIYKAHIQTNVTKPSFRQFRQKAQLLGRISDVQNASNSRRHLESKQEVQEEPTK